MNFRFGVFMFLGLAVILTGCGAGGAAAGPGNGVVPQVQDEEIPAWVQELPEGQEPGAHPSIGQTALYIAQAYNAEEEADAERYFNQALESAQEALAEDPQNAEVMRQAGEAMVGLGRLEEAAAMFDRAEEIYPRILWETRVLREIAWAEEINQGFEQHNAGDLEGALESFQRAHMIYKQRPEAMMNIASLYSEMEQYDEAIDMFGQTIEVIEGPWTDRADEETREGWLEQLDVARSNRAQLLLFQERYGEAADALAPLVEDDPDNLQLRASYGAALVGAERMDEAEALFDALLNRPGLNAGDYYSIGVGLYQAESYDRAAVAFGEAFERVPEHRDVVQNLAQSYYMDENWEALLPVAEQFINIDPLNENAYSFRAQALIRMDRDQEGVAVLEEREALEFVMQGMELQFAGDDLVLVGQVLNRSAAAGSTVTLRIHFSDMQGGSLGSQDATFQLGDEGEAAVFQVTVPDEGAGFGFRYEVL